MTYPASVGLESESPEPCPANLDSEGAASLEVVDTDEVVVALELVLD